MKNEFVTYKQALALKKLGYNEQCLAYYGYWKKLYPIDTDFKSFRGLGDGLIAAPLKQQVFDFFREMYGFHFYSYQIKLYPDGDYPTKIWLGKINDEFVTTENGLAKSHFYSYEEAENACIDKLIELAKKQEDVQLSK